MPHILSARVREGRSHWEVCENAVYFSCTHSCVPSIECGKTGTSHPPHWRPSRICTMALAFQLMLASASEPMRFKLRQRILIGPEFVFVRRNVILTAFKLEKNSQRRRRTGGLKTKTKKNFREVQSDTTYYTTYVFLFRWKKINITTLPDDRSLSAPAQLYYVSRTKDREAFRAVSRLCYLRDACLNNITLKVVEMHKLTPTVRLYYIIHTLSSRHPSSSFTNCDLQHNSAVNSPVPLSNISPRA